MPPDNSQVNMSKTAKVSPHDPKQNLILAALPEEDYNRILPNLQFIPMPLGWTMSQSGDHVNFLHFPTSGIISLIYDLENGSKSEIALVGNEGMVGISIFMGGDSMPSSTEVQSVGTAYRISRKFMKQEFAHGGQLQHLALLYTQTLINQTAQTAVCNQHHSLDQQLCRWLLMTLDRLHESEVVITHELLGNLLGVRRESITVAAGNLQKDAIITYSRGLIKVLDRPKLELRVCECYKVVKNEFKRLLPHRKNKTK